MKRKVYILTLLSVFFISTTGLPLTVSICSMNDTHTTEHCGMTPKKMEDHSCCSKDQAKAKVNIILTDQGPCCQLRIVDNNISDKYVTTSNDAGGSKFSVKTIVTLNYLDSASQIIPYYNIFTSSSPPTLSDNHIYLSNSVFLI